eukprot:5485190-Amphidinium_carterae.2
MRNPIRIHRIKHGSIVAKRDGPSKEQKRREINEPAAQETPPAGPLQSVPGFTDRRLCGRQCCLHYFRLVAHRPGIAPLNQDPYSSDRLGESRGILGMQVCTSSAVSSIL